MKAFAQEEILEAQKKLEVIEHELQILLLPKDPNDSRNIFLEIRAGTGGDESALFAGDLLRMYLRYAEDHRWQTEIVSKNDSELGGYKEVIVRIIGEGAYSKLKFESGGHRVQRVPATESQGRVHTSACTVAVLPELDEIGEVNLNPADLRIDVFRASGAGGQQAKEASERKSLIGSGDRSERIRTYNYPQGRVTDHRINLTLYRLEAIMNGDLEEIITALTTQHQAEQLAALA